MSKHSFRIYYEDTDGAGVVYNANYLKYAERARTEMLRDAGILQTELREKEGIFFVVRKVEMDLLKPARLDDLIEVHSSIEHSSGVTMSFHQEIICGEVTLATLHSLIVCVNTAMRPTRVPEHIKEKLLILPTMG